MFISVLMQLCITITIPLGLLGLKFWQSSKEKSGQNRMLSLSTALVEFHKAQCYFISAIEVAILVLNRQAYKDTRERSGGPIFDMMLSFSLSMNGFLPIVFALYCISHYSRLTWHIITLSSIAVVSSTVALTSAYIWTWKRLNAAGSVGNDADVLPYLVEAAYLVCGLQPGTFHNLIKVTEIRVFRILLIYTYCILCGVWCLIRHILDAPPRRSIRARIVKALERLAQASPLTRLPRTIRNEARPHFPESDLGTMLLVSFLPV